MKFSDKIQQQTERRFETLKDALGEKFFLKLSLKIKDLGELSFLIKWMLVNSPLEDLTSYPFSLYENTARHALFLRENSPFCLSLDEGDFLSYVLHPRVNDEELSDCREFFYALLKERVTGLDAESAALKVNEFCAENVSYKPSDLRTRSALATYNAGTGRCGEESVFAVNALRAVGIPARQVYVPRWSHCDDNHAWVEVLIGGAWHYLGACEIDGILDCGWFNRAASRAMLVYARRFGAPSEFEDVIFSERNLYYINVLPRYAACREFKIFVRDFEDRPAAGARVDILILNEAKFVPVARLRADEEGKCSLKLGLGSVCVRFYERGVMSEYLVDTSLQESAILRATGKCIEGEFSFLAPKGEEKSQKYPTAAQKQEALKGRVRAEERRVKKPTVCVFDNMDKGFNKQQREDFTAVLTPKDLQDVSEATLWDVYSTSYVHEEDFPRDIYLKYILCPRVENEPLLPYREELLETYCISLDFCKRIQINTASPPITRYYSARIPVEWKSFPIDERAKDIYSVKILRSMGLPGRFSPSCNKPEYYCAACGNFVPLDKIPRGYLKLTLDTDDEFSLAHIDGRGEITAALRCGESTTVAVPAGIYRLIVQHRLPNGNIRAAAKMIYVCADEEKEARVEGIAAVKDEDLLIELPLQGTFLRDLSGAVALLDQNTEPSEHFLAEIKDNFDIPLSVWEPEGGKSHLEGASVFSALEEEEVARKLFLEPGEYPLLLIIKDGVCRFAMAGYRVGSAQMLKKAYKMIF